MTGHCPSISEKAARPLDVRGPSTMWSAAACRRPRLAPRFIPSRFQRRMPSLPVGRALRAALPAIAALAMLAGCQTGSKPIVVERTFRSPREGWDFGFKDFVIASWWGPANVDAQYEYYKKAGFNLVMYGRYAPEDSLIPALDLAEKHGLKVMFDTYTRNRTPWGGLPSGYRDDDFHHHATAPELRWLHEKVGGHPALAGYLLGDDQSGLPPDIVENTHFLREKAPHLFPWVCQNYMAPQSLAYHGNPLLNPQIYPTLYQQDLSGPDQMRSFCDSLQALRNGCEKYGLVSAVQSDSIVRFQAYASVAYGAQGIWYFTYCFGFVGKGGMDDPQGTSGGEAQTEEEVKETLRPTWWTASEANARLAAWGPEVMGRHTAGLFDTGWDAAGAQPPGPGKLVESMSDDLLVGILTAPGKAPLAMVVDKRVSKEFGAVGEREVEIRFAPAVTGTDVLETAARRQVDGPTVRLTLTGGEGQLLALTGKSIALPEGTARVSGPILIDVTGGESRRFPVRWTSDSALPIVVRGAFEKNDFFEPQPGRVDLALPPKGSKTINLGVRSIKRAETVGEAPPLIMTWTSAHRLPDGSSVEIDEAKRLAIVPMIDCSRRTAPVKVDGRLDEWKDLPFACRKPAMIKLDASTWHGPSDSSFRFATAYDDEHLYIAIDVIDDDVSARPGVNPWEEDGVEVRLDARPDPWRSLCDGGGDLHDFLFLGLTPGKTVEQMGKYRWDAIPEGVEALTLTTDKGHATEIAIPAAYLNERQKEPWRFFRLNIAVSDHDGPDSRSPGAAHIWWRADWRAAESYDGSGTFRRR